MSFWLRAAAPDAAVDRQLGAEERRDLVALLKRATKDLLVAHVSAGRPLSVSAGERVLAVLEAVFLYAWNVELNKGPGYWRVLAEVHRSGVTDSVAKENVSKVEQARLSSDLGRGRLFLRLALVTQTLAYSVHKLQESHVLHKYYGPEAVWTSEEGAPVASILISLNAVPFDAATVVG